ncbi:hypothetical protein Mpt1_c14280 [Candidatus Methanoplasma termitum]|uniref:Uncharacterized protein n=1 Tax=Candidatus Methanoplasma termitum TaxID=1577791 RepID=A0A0A7LDY3_9ARCH|nr:hypothetical protein [Candidatus Methanoplasma termitum]AIZ57284.1 hypothetical protein Mpt1_c14280 [Candidatus Methanoplasma termitum]MCL2334063.1 hypothetical protein [Candidatus Methanoplasma sp.]
MSKTRKSSSRSRWIIAAFIVAMFVFIPFTLHENTDSSAANGNSANNMLPDINQGDKAGISLNLNSDKAFQVAKIIMADAGNYIVQEDPSMAQLVDAISSSKNLNEALNKLSGSGYAVSIDSGNLSLSIDFLVKEKNSNGYKMTLTYSLRGDLGITEVNNDPYYQLIGFPNNVKPTDAISMSIEAGGSLNINLTSEFIPRTIDAQTTITISGKSTSNYTYGYNNYYPYTSYYTYTPNTVDNISEHVTASTSFAISVNGSDMTNADYDRALNGEDVFVDMAYSIRMTETSNGYPSTPINVSDTTSFNLKNSAVPSTSGTSSADSKKINNIIKTAWNNGTLPTYAQFIDAFGSEMSSQISQTDYNQTMNQIRAPFAAYMTAANDSVDYLEGNGLSWYYNIGGDQIHSNDSSNSSLSSGTLIYILIIIIVIIVIVVAVLLYMRSKKNKSKQAP